MFHPFFGLHNFLTLTGMESCLPQAIMVRLEKSYTIRLASSKTFGENIFFIGDVPIVLGPRA